MYEIIFEEMEAMYPGKALITAEEVCRFLGCEIAVVYNWNKRANPKKRPPSIAVGKELRYPKWQYNLQSRLESQILPEIGRDTLDSFDSKKIYSYYFLLKERGLCHASIWKYHTVLCQIGDAYCENHPGAENPFRAVKDVKKRFPAQPATRDINFLTSEELEKLFKAASKAKSKRLENFIRVLAGTGFRRSEALNLKWKDIDWSSGFIHVRKSKNGKSRMVPIEDAVRKILKALPRINELVFAREDGSPYDPDSLLPPLKRAATNAGIEKRVDLHTLRHSYGSNKIRHGWGLKKVSTQICQFSS